LVAPPPFSDLIELQKISHIWERFKSGSRCSQRTFHADNKENRMRSNLIGLAALMASLPAVAGATPTTANSGTTADPSATRYQHEEEDEIPWGLLGLLGLAGLLGLKRRDDQVHGDRRTGTGNRM
jgi:MYXO-CTERM domain-containing protein